MQRSGLWGSTSRGSGGIGVGISCLSASEVCVEVGTASNFGHVRP